MKKSIILTAFVAFAANWLHSMWTARKSPLGNRLSRLAKQTGELIIKVLNGTDEPYRRNFDIANATTVAPIGKVIKLSGNAEDENSFDQPTKLSPQTILFGKFDKQFCYEFEPMSFTILRIKVN